MLPQRGFRRQAAPYVYSNSMRACWGNASHTARGGVDNQVDDSARRARLVGLTSATPPVAEWTTTTTPPLRGPQTSRFALATTPNAPRRTTAAAPPPPYASQRAVEGPAAHAWKLEQHPASRPRTPAAKPTPSEPRTPPELSVRARLRCSSRASLPLTPQAGTPTATIGMRPATSLQTKPKSVELTPSGCRASRVLLRVQR